MTTLSRHTRQQPFLQLRGISKSYPGVQALEDVSLSISCGEVIGLIGENGAGKSTLMKILGGVIAPTKGDIVLDGQKLAALTIHDSLAAGIAFVHQELNIFDNLDVAANIFIGREAQHWSLIDQQSMYAQTESLLQRLGCGFSANTQAASLSIAQRQQIEIARGLSQGARLIVLDEPTSSLTPTETDQLLGIIADLKQSGVGVIFISHRLGEVRQCSDRIFVLRDGKMVSTLRREEASHQAMIQLMIGRNINELYISPQQPVGQAVMEVKELNTGVGGIRGSASFALHRGEILGFAGLIGAGRSEIARVIFGIDKARSGTLIFEGKPLQLHHPGDAIQHGIFLIPEDRKGAGLIVDDSVVGNLCLPDLLRYAWFGLLNQTSQLANAMRQIKALQIKVAHPKVPVGTLSGGNQQKVVLGKWLAMSPKLIIFDEPTRGVDIGAKAEIYALMRQLADSGVAIMMISSDMEEIIGVSDRVAVMCEGRLSGILTREHVNEEAIMNLAIGHGTKEAEHA